MPTHTVQSRALDAIYDPVYTVSSRGAHAPTTRYRGAAGPSGKHDGGAVSGGNRAKYFKRPVLPHLQSVAPEVLLAPIAQKVQEAREEEDTSATKTVGVQTTYRDSEAQTQPYTPDYTIRIGGAEPEVLTLESLTHERGLPAGLAEVEWIERNREKKQFEVSLPPMTDEASFELRKSMMEEQEVQDWSYREREIDRAQTERLNLLTQALSERDQENEFLSEQRVDAIRERREAEKEARIAKIRQHRVMAQRKISKQRTESSFQERTGRDVIEEYSDFSSKVYAQVTRDGKLQDASIEEVTDGPRNSTSIAALCDLEASLPPRMTNVNVRKPRSSAKITSSFDRKNAIARSHLEKMASLIQRNKEKELQRDNKGSHAENIPRWKFNQQEKIVRPPTPKVPDEAPETAETENALILLQRLIRGRAVQNMMYEGKERRSELIRELRDYEEKGTLAEGGESALSKEERASSMARDMVQGETISNMLDFLYKQLQRTKQHARLQSFITGASNDRRTREVVEGGRRHAEEVLRSRYDTVFQHIQRVHEETVDDYLEELIDSAIEQDATAIASHEANVRQEVLVPMLDQLQHGEETFESDDMIVRDLLASFIFPEVERQRIQMEMANKEKRFLVAAHDSILSAIGSSKEDAAQSKGNDNRE